MDSILPCKLAFGPGVSISHRQYFEERFSFKHRLSVADVRVVEDLLDWSQDVPVLLVLCLQHSSLEQIRKWSHAHPFLQLVVVNVSPDKAMLCHRSGAWEMFGENDELSIRFPILEARWQEWIHLRKPSSNKVEGKALVPSISPAMRKIYQRLRRVKDRLVHVWLEGEAGTGKKMFARQLHKESIFNHRPFYIIHIHGGDNAEQMLFGKGTTGKTQPGFLELAQGATIYIDGILAMPLSCQARLLQSLRDAAIERDGVKYPFHARIVAASRTSPEKVIRKGQFLPELFNALSDIHQAVPPLRERRDDIPLLSSYFAEGFAKENDYIFEAFAPQSINKLMQHTWPGNIRELRSVCELAVVVSDKANITPEHIFINGMAFSDDEVEMTLSEYTRRFIQEKLRAYDFNVLETAEKIGVGKSTLYRMIKNGELELK